jgi:hypothetical protein
MSLHCSLFFIETISFPDVVESTVVRCMNLLLSFGDLFMQEFFEFVCVVSQKRRIELEDNKDRPVIHINS